MKNPHASRRAGLSVAVVAILLLFAAGLRLALTPAPPEDDQVPAGAAGWTVIERAETAMGTVVRFEVACRDETARREKAIAAIAKSKEAIERLEQMASSYREDSDLSRINRAAGSGQPVTVPPEMIGILKEARQVSELSNGAFDITFAAVGKLWHLDPADPVIPTDKQIAEALKLVDYRKVEIDEAASTVYLPEPGMSINLGGIAKGTAVDWALEAIRSQGFSGAVVEAGGDLATIGEKSPGVPWKIGIQHPRNREQLLGEISVSDKAVVTSGDYERFVEINGVRYHHILDTKTGRPSRKSISVTVIAGDCQTADALSTAFFVMGPTEAVKLANTLPDVECLCLGADEKIKTSDGFPISGLQ